MERSEQIDQLATALSKFQGSLEQPKLNSTVKVKTRTGGEYSFKYADLSECKAGGNAAHRGRLFVAHGIDAQLRAVD